MFHTRLMTATGLLTAALAVSAHASPYLHVQRFDADSPGALPTGWSLQSGTLNLANTSVQPHGTAPSPSRVFQIGQTGENWELRVSYPSFNLNPPEKLAYQFDLNVDFINGNDSEGFLFRTWTNSSNIDSGYPRILRNGAQWRMYNVNNVANLSPNYTTANFNFDQWYTLRVEFHPTSASAGQVKWYVGDNAADLLADLSDDLVLTETYSGKLASQTQGMKIFDIRTVVGASGPGARMYIDNLSIVTPEPAGLALLVIGSCLALRRRRA